MVNRLCGPVVALLLLVGPLLLGSVAGTGNVTTGPMLLEEAEEVAMITINGSVEWYRPRPRRLDTATVWCISIPNTSDTSLQSSLDWACGPLANQGQVNCGPINEGGICYDPNTLAHHCDWAFNAYFQRMNGSSDACDFSGTAEQVSIDPSSGTCVFQGSNVTLNGSSPGTGPSSSPLSPAGTPIYSPNAASEAWQPHHLFSTATASILLAYLFT